MKCSLLKIVHSCSWSFKQCSFLIALCKTSMSTSIVQLTFVLSMNTYTIGGLSFGWLLSIRSSRLQEGCFTRKHGSTKTRPRKLWNKFITSDIHISTHFILLQSFHHNNILCKPCSIHYHSYFFIVVNISSPYCSHGMPFQRIYIFSKFRVIQSSKVLCTRRISSKIGYLATWENAVST